MATTLLIEEERGTCTGRYHQHRGYYAGDFSGPWTPEPGIPVAAHAEPTFRLTTRTSSSGGDAHPLAGSTYAA